MDAVLSLFKPFEYEEHAPDGGVANIAKTAQICNELLSCYLKLTAAARQANQSFMLNDAFGNLQANIVDRTLNFDDGRAQVICAVLAGAALCQTPLVMDLTDGEVHHLLRLEGQELVVYRDCTPKQVIGSPTMEDVLLVICIWEPLGMACVASTRLFTS